MTDLDRNSKLDTVFFSDRATGLDVDLSQYLTDLAGQVESPSARTAITASREISVKFSFIAGKAGTLIHHGLADQSAYTYRALITGGQIQCHDDSGTLLVKEALPISNAAISHAFVLHWSSFVLPTGDIRHEVMIHNIDEDLYKFKFIDSTEPTTSNAWEFAIAPAVSPYNDTIASVRIGGRYHSLTEGYEDWIDETTDPTPDAAKRCEGTPVTNTTEIADHESFAGPAIIVAGRAAHQAGRRLLSPIVNQLVASPEVLQSTYVPDEWHRLAWGSAQIRLALHLLWRRPVPPVVREVYVRVHVLHWSTGASVVPVYLRCYSLNTLPTVFNEADTPLYFHTVETNSNTDDGVGGDGRWVTLGRLPVARDSRGFSYFALGYDFNHGSAHAQLANTRFRFQAVTIDPFPSDESAGPSGLDLQEGY